MARAAKVAGPGLKQGLTVKLKHAGLGGEGDGEGKGGREREREGGGRIKKDGRERIRPGRGKEREERSRSLGKLTTGPNLRKGRVKTRPRHESVQKDETTIKLRNR
mgnify:CR=1 FL=1